MVFELKVEGRRGEKRREEKTVMGQREGVVFGYIYI